MIPTALGALVFFRVVADCKGRPAALLLEFGAGERDAVAALTARAEVENLTLSMPCLFTPAAVDDALAAALQVRGWRALGPASVCRADQHLPDACAPGVSWIDGDWCMAPPLVSPSAQVAERGIALQMVQLVALDADTHEIEALLRRAPAISYNLLRLVNSLGVGGGRRIISFSQALLLLGRQQLRRWLNLVLFAARQGDVRSHMLLARVSLRARALEMLARARGLDKITQEQAFMTGMFSLLGVLFCMPLAQVLAPLALGEAVQAALLRREGELGMLLTLFEALEKGDFASAAVQVDGLQIERAACNLALVDAAAWMQGAVRESQGGHA
jgi:EAL and modified HD-GYP domain-containing signal transduction protein